MNQCKAKTKKGTRCSREAPGTGILSGRCTQHRKMISAKIREASKHKKGIYKGVKSRKRMPFLGTTVMLPAFPESHLRMSGLMSGKEFYAKKKEKIS